MQKFLILDYLPDPVGLNQGRLQPKIVTGFKRSEVTDIFNINSTWEPLGDDKDKLYFFPGCTVPRFKVREKYSVTIKPNNATAAFISTSNVTGSDYTFKHYTDVLPVPYDIIKPWLKNLREIQIFEIIDSLVLSMNLLDIYLVNRLWFDHCYLNTFTRDNSSLYSVIGNRYEKKMGPQNHILALRPNSEILKLKCPIYSEKDILTRLNENKLIIDFAKYNELRNFGKTRTQENLVLMMELMSNSDFEKSVMQLLMLLREFGQRIAQLKEVNHVNFKSLLSFFDLDVHQIQSMNIMKLTSILKNHKQFTKENAFILGRLCMNDYIPKDTDNGDIWIKGYVLNERGLNYLDS